MSAERARRWLRKAAERAAPPGPATNPLRRADRILCRELGISRKAMKKMGRQVALAMLEDKLVALKNGAAPPPTGLAVVDAE